MKLGVFTVMLPDLKPEEAVRELKATGYDGVEWRVTRIEEGSKEEPPSFWGNNLCTLEPTEEAAQRARLLCEEHGLEIPGLGTYVDVGDWNGLEEAVRFAVVARAPQVRVRPPNPRDGEPYERCFAAAREFYGAAEGLARGSGVKVLTEIHHQTICPSASAAARLLSGFDPGLVGAIFDPGNMVFEGYEDYRMGLELLGPYLAHVHVKNAAFDAPEGGGVWEPRWAPLENGVVDFARFFGILREFGYDGWLVVEDFSAARPSRESLRHNARFIRERLEEIESPP